MQHLKTLVPRLAGWGVLVLGDVILDEYVIGIAERMSREAPIPVLELVERRFIPGGAANPASNIVALQSKAFQVGIVGHDTTSTHLYSELKKRGIEAEDLIGCEDRPTTLKTRILAQMGLTFPQQVARVDTLSRQSVTPDIAQKIFEHVERRVNADRIHAALFSDYQIGMLTPSLVTLLRDFFVDRRMMLIADAQGALEKYAGFDVVKCNAQDASNYLGRTLRSETDFITAARELCVALGCRRAMVITRGADGATLTESNGTVTHCPAPDVSDVYDTVGAGDTAIAVMTLALLGGATPTEAVQLANYASGIVVRHVGNYTPSPDELIEALEA